MAAPVLKASRPVAEPSPEGQCSVLARASRYSTRQQVASLLEADPTNAVTLPMQLKVLQSLYTPASESFWSLNVKFPKTLCKVGSGFAHGNVLRV